MTIHLLMTRAEAEAKIARHRQDREPHVKRPIALAEAATVCDALVALEIVKFAPTERETG